MKEKMDKEDIKQPLPLDKRETKPLSATHFYGIWKDDDSVDADNLNEEIKTSRKFRDDIETF